MVFYSYDALHLSGKSTISYFVQIYSMHVKERGILSLIFDYSYFKGEMLNFKPQKSTFSVKKSSLPVLKVPNIGVVNQLYHI